MKPKARKIEAKTKRKKSSSSSELTAPTDSTIIRHIINEYPQKTPLEFLLKWGTKDDFQVNACDSFSSSFEFMDSVSVQEKPKKKCKDNPFDDIDVYGSSANGEAYSIDMHCRDFNIFASCEGRYIFIWKLNTSPHHTSPQLIHTIKLCNHDQNMNLYCIRWGVWNDKDILAVCGEPNFVIIYEIDIQCSNTKDISKLLGELRGHGNSVYCVAFHPDMNGLILTGSTDDSIRLWDLNLNFETIAIFEGHVAGISSLSFHESGNYFVSGGMDNTCRVYHIEDQVWKYRKFKMEFKEACSSPHSQPSTQQLTREGSSSSCMANSKIEPISVPILQCKCTFSYHKGYVDSCLFMGDVILSKTSTSEKSTNDPGDSVIAWVPDSVFVNEQETEEFNITSEEDEVSIIHRFKGSSCMFWWLKMALSDRYLARPLHNGIVEIFDLNDVGRASYTSPRTRLKHPSGVHDKNNHGSEDLIRECVFSKDQKYLFVLQQTGRITRWAIKHR
ncbi:hypothetical protein C9374_004287 [Naegleria lovaniensis]|uniref:Guanine nucleotide-binding protein subunit beta-like protein n=1 Tax=Naegleria lovaniensis TaxID=51637 RepID=A0AA88KPD5_NAELO|nr:uncharacterized protein C9374_004287 [Naegleria lovaniensis]KAG2383616.1 hypothetical protein C9374_004287 [Naegleria lovaniensis]